MLKAIDTATTGLLQAERRATDIARDILRETSKSASFKDELNTENLPPTTEPDVQTTGQTAQATTGSDYGNLIQQFADLRAEERAFEANAAVFKRADEALGTLIDDKS